MTRKLGNFFLIVGLLLLVVFLAAPTKSSFYFNFCFGGMALLVLALALRQISKEEQPKSERFSLLRKLLGIKPEE